MPFCLEHDRDGRNRYRHALWGSIKYRLNVSGGSAARHIGLSGFNSQWVTVVVVNPRFNHLVITSASKTLRPRTHIATNIDRSVGCALEDARDRFLVGERTCSKTTLRHNFLRARKRGKLLLEIGFQLTIRFCFLILEPADPLIKFVSQTHR